MLVFEPPPPAYTPPVKYVTLTVALIGRYIGTATVIHRSVTIADTAFI